MCGSPTSWRWEEEKVLYWLLALLCCVVLLPFLGLADFNTKGEPREAVVALSMLQSGDWILPVNNGGEMPYKPPLFHWLVAICSWFTGGEVNEYSSRLPSALSLIALTLGTFVFFRRRCGLHTAFVTALLTFTSLELHRAGMNTRVDMLLTALTAGAVMSLYSWYVKGCRRVPWGAILLMSMATLTKGPVGVLVPCLVCGVFMLLRGMNFFKAALWMILWGVMSLIIPLCWYVAAYGRGGQEFLDLVMEENFGRMTSTMSYDSCVNPWPYNILSLITGWIPWTLAALMSLAALRRSDFRWNTAGIIPRLKVWLKSVKPVRLMALTAVTVIFVFYCFPQSKRSVYLMPLYPFMALFMTELLEWTAKRKKVLVQAFGDVIAGLGILLTAVFIAVKAGVVPDTLVDHGRHGAQNAAMLQALRDSGGFMIWLWTACAPAGALLWWWLWRSRGETWRRLSAIAVTICGIYMTLAGVWQPAVLNVRSAKPVARQITELLAPQAQIYELIGYAEFQAGDPVHFFELNFYMGDTIRNFVREHPRSGFLIVSDDDVRDYLPQLEQQGYRFMPVADTERPLMKLPSKVMAFERSGADKPVTLTDMHPANQ